MIKLLPIIFIPIFLGLSGCLESTSSSNTKEKPPATKSKQDLSPPQFTFNLELPVKIPLFSLVNLPIPNITDTVDGDISEYVIEHNINAGSLGSYAATYQARDKAGNEAEITIPVLVVDEEKPVVTIIGDLTVSISMGEIFSDPGASVTDNSKELLIVDYPIVKTDKPGVWTVNYTATDSSGNTGKAIRIISVKDETAPEIELIGGLEDFVFINSEYSDPGFKAFDNWDETVEVITTTNLDTSTLGQYEIKYKAEDSAGNSASAIRTVNVINRPVVFNSRSSVAPRIAAIADQYVESTLDITPEVINEASLNGNVHWIKTFGPDNANVHPLTGRVTWDIPINMPSESFHIGLKASSKEEEVHTNFIVHVGLTPDQVMVVGPNGDYEKIGQAMAGMKEGGGTVIVEAGVYEGEDNCICLTSFGALRLPKSGSADSFTTIMSRHPGEAILQDGAYIRVQALNGREPTSYVAFKGFLIKDGEASTFGYGSNSQESTARPHHIKFIRNGVQGGEKASPFSAFRSDFILFENNYAFGGGRYKFTSYQAEGIVMRRNVARYDRGTVSGEPKGTYSIYTTKGALISNNIAIDSDQSQFTNQGELAGEFTTPTTSGDTQAQFHRNIQLNSEYLFGNMDDQQNSGGGDSDVEHHHVISWDVRPYSRYVMTWGSAWFNHMTMGDVTPRNFGDNLFNGYHENTRGVTNSILHNISNGDLFYGFSQELNHETNGRFVERYGVAGNNLSQITGTLNVYKSVIEDNTALNPIWSPENEEGGLRYLPVMEMNSNMSGITEQGSDLGAQVLYMKGVSGTFFGEENYDLDTSTPMWTFPMEHIIKAKMAEYSYDGPTYQGHYTNRTVSGTGTLTGERGFALPENEMTDYIWGYLGNVPPPIEVTVVEVEGGYKLQWNPPSSESPLVH